ncbi:MAG: hypothetical protein R3213_03245 [Flavobacteriaceae bacterium]|nr:hypothetical protein [Flavobacteriaceae bacterium]
MKNLLLASVLLFSTLIAFAQKEFHVTPQGKSSGNGSLQTPWDLQTALSQSSLNPGDIIWVHQGEYRGRFVSTISSGEKDKPILVSAYRDDKVVLNGNVNSTAKSVLEVKGGNVIFRNLEITFLGDFSRKETDENFQKVDGINHNAGANCKFINLKIHNNPGSGMGSWKATGGTEILDCLIYNNGFISKAGRGSGVGLYVQNETEDERIIANNTIFNNYYKGIEVWSANKNASNSYVKNISLKNNAAFNNGSPAGGFKDNLIVGTDDRNGVNVARNIKIIDNFFYHNTDLAVGQVGGDAASVTIGFSDTAPVENVILEGNTIIGRNNSFRILSANSLTMKDNIAYCGYVHLRASTLDNIKNWKTSNNKYYTKKGNAFRFIKNQDYSLEALQNEFKIDSNTEWKNVKNFQRETSFQITEFYENPLKFKVSILSPYSSTPLVDFGPFEVKKGTHYKIWDVENPSEVLTEGELKEDKKIEFNLASENFEMPLHNDQAQKSLGNFGVFIIEFYPEE